MIETLGPEKDVDGLHPMNLGRLAQGLPSLVPNTPAGGMEILRRYEIRAGGTQSGRRRTLERRGQADGVAAAGATCDGHDLPFAHA